MAHGEEKAKRWRITLSDIGIAIAGLCLSLSLGLAFVRVQDQITALISAFTAAFIVGGSGGFVVARFLGRPVKCGTPAPSTKKLNHHWCGAFRRLH